MAISFVASASAAAASVSLPSGWVPGDLAVVLAHRDGSTTAPSLPTGWTNIVDGGANTNSARAGYRVLATGDTSTGTWTNATSVIVVILRGADRAQPIGASAQTGGASTSMSFPALTLHVQESGLSWVLLMGGHRTATDAHTVALAGTSNRSATTTDICAHTAEGVTSWSATSKTVNANSGWRTVSIEIIRERPTHTRSYLVS